MKTKLLLVITLLFVSFSLHSKVGEKIYQKSCAACHSNGAETTKVPMLFGQEKKFLEKALHDFKSGKRKDHIMFSMETIAASLSDQEIKDVSYFLSAQDICDIKVTIDTKATGWIQKFKDGRTLSQTKSCMHCHGSFHHAAPKLYGQKKSYLKHSLEMFKADKRPGFFKMIEIAKSLTKDDMEKISHYLNGMRLMRDCGP